MIIDVSLKVEDRQQCDTRVLVHSDERPRGPPAGDRRLQDAPTGQVSQLPLSNHVKMLERRAGRQAGLPDPQGPTGQQLLRDGVSAAPVPFAPWPLGGSKESDTGLDRRSAKPGGVAVKHKPVQRVKAPLITTIILPSSDFSFLETHNAQLIYMLSKRGLVL